MKKGLFLIAAAIVCMFSITSCEEGFTMNATDVEIDNILGSASIYVYDTVLFDTVHMEFSSSIFDNLSGQPDTDGIVHYSGFGLNANVDLANADLVYPLAIIKTSDTTTGVYTFSNFITLDFIKTLERDSIINLVTEPNDQSMLVIAQSDTSWLLAYAGNIVINTYPAVGHIVEGEFNNVLAYTVTMSKVNELNYIVNFITNYTPGTPIPPDIMQYLSYATHPEDLIELFFSTCVINGEINSRRTSIVHDLVDQLRQGSISK